MILACQNCNTTFTLDENLIPEGGRSVRCSVCKKVFTAQREEEQPAAPEETVPEAAVAEEAPDAAAPDAAAPDTADGDAADGGAAAADFAAQLEDFDIPDDDPVDDDPAEAASNDALSVMGGDDDSGDLSVPDDLLDDMEKDDIIDDDTAEGRKNLSAEEEAEMSVLEPGENSSNVVLDIDKEAKKRTKGKGKKLLLVFLLLIFLGGGAAAGIYFFMPDLLSSLPNMSSLPIPGLSKEAETEEKQEPETASEEEVEGILLQDLRQYYVKNEKVGRVFVIEGNALNQFESPRELITLNATLLDAQQQVVDSLRLLAGNKLSLFQLEVSSQEEILAALQDEAGIGANNIDLQPQEMVPFMLVFFNPPNTITQYKVSVVSVKKP